MILSEVFERVRRGVPGYRDGPSRLGERPCRLPPSTPSSRTWPSGSIPVRCCSPTSSTSWPWSSARSAPRSKRRLQEYGRVPSASRARPFTTRSTAWSRPSAPRWCGTPPRRWHPGHRGDGRCGAEAVADGVPACGSSTAATCPAPSTASSRSAPSGPAPCRGRPWWFRPRADAGRRRHPLRGRPRPGAVDDRAGPGLGRPRRTVGRRP